MDKLQAQGVNGGFFINPKNGLNYVYLKGYNNKREAVDAYHSKLDGTYTGDAWIMNVNGVESGGGSPLLVAVANKSKSKYDDNILQKNVSPTKGNLAKVSYSTYKINGLGSGFYIIANVFKSASNARRFVKELNAKGLNASYFINPENNYRYVYLKKHDTWNNALTSYYSKLNASYDDEMWIMRVKPNSNS